VSRVVGMREAYDTSANAWVQGPEGAYEVMAEVLVTSAGAAVVGARVLDVGAGTGTASRAAKRAGALLVVGVDASISMLKAGRGWDGAVVSDAMALPFGTDAFDVAVGAFCLGHLPDPVAGMTETRRVAGLLAASAFLTGWVHPAKTLVDETAQRFGFALPAWYRLIKSGPAAAVDDPERLAAAAVDAGYHDVTVRVHDVDVGLRTPEQIAAWRLGMAHLAPFVAALDPRRRTELHRACVDVLDGAPSVVVPMVILVATT
jgi:ubiquinone/menaquinone biosynthesis C-methylase UbiE